MNYAFMASANCICDALQMSSPKQFILYLFCVAVAVVYDDRILADYMRAQLNPFSIKRYGVVAIVNIAYGSVFMLRFLTTSFCKGLLLNQ